MDPIERERSILKMSILLIKDKLTELEETYSYARQKRESILGWKELETTSQTRSLYNKAKKDIKTTMDDINKNIIEHQDKLDELQGKLEIL